MSTQSKQWTLYKKAFHLGVNNLKRNKFLSLASVIVIAILLFIFNVILSINYTVQNTLGELNKKVDLIIYLQDSAIKTPIILEGFIGNVSKQPGVLNVKYVSQSDALEQINALQPETAEFIQKYQIKNPLPASINISTSDPEYHTAIISYIKSNYPNIISSINENNDEQNNRLRKIINNLANVQNFADQIIFWIVLVFLVGGILIVLNSIQIAIFSRKDELFIMQLIGASHNFIRLPFLLEGAFYAALAVLLNILLLFGLSLSTQDGNAAFALWSFGNWDVILVIAIELLISIGICMASAFAATQGYLHKKLNF